MQFEPVIGLEVHVQLATKTKIFCNCSTAFGQVQNTSTCPVCLGLPGVLPVFNKKVMDYAIKASIAINCKINSFSQFARKNYFYPDLPKAYQISQFDLPLAEHGFLTVEREDGTEARIGITRLHIEEDAGKLIHSDSPVDSESMVDYNRTGVPLIEIVSEPEIASSQDARLYLLKLKSILEYLEVSDCNMEEGSLRCDANISVRPKGSTVLGTKAEIKNLNSFKYLQKAVEYEIERQVEVIEDGGRVVQETRLWDTSKEMTFSMRSKEEAHDYRYFPEPDLAPVETDALLIEQVRKSLPELPDEKGERFVSEYKIPRYDACVITSSKPLATYFEEAVSCHDNPKIVSNWVMGDLQKELKSGNISIEKCPVTPIFLGKILANIDNGVISGKIAKTVFEECFKTGKDPEIIIKEKGLVQISDTGAIMEIINTVLDENPGPLSQYLQGKHQTFGFFIGQVMKATKGKANPGAVNKLLKEALSKRA